MNWIMQFVYNMYNIQYNDRAIILHKITHSGISRGNPFGPNHLIWMTKFLLAKFYFQAAAT